MLWLQNYDVFNELAHFDPDRTIVEIKYRSGLEGDPLEKINGFYSYCESKFLSIYALRKCLFIAFAGRHFMVDDFCKIIYKGESGKAWIALCKGDMLYFDLKYTVLEGGGDDDDLTPFIGSESLDFGLFVANIVNDPSRKAAFIEVND